VKRLLLAAAMLLVAWSAAVAQSTTARVQGVVSSAEGAPVAGALVQARASRTGVVRTATTDASGRYTFDLLEPGEWSFVARSPQGVLSDSKSVVLRLQQNLRVDLAVGAGLVEEVEVTDEVPLLDPTRVGGELRIGRVETEQIPIAARNVTDLALLDASVRVAPAGNYYGERGSAFVINGQTGRSNSFLVDGLDNNDQSSGTNLNASFSQLVVSEFVVLTHQYAAEFGRASGGVVNIVTGRGGNELESAFFAQGSAARWNAPGELVSTLPGEGAESGSGFQTGFRASGPFVKDKAFWFVAYEHQGAEEVTPYTGTTENGIAGGRVAGQRRDDNLFLRTDFNLDTNNVLMVRLSADDRKTPNLNVGGVVTPESGFKVDEEDFQLAANLTSVLSPTATNELRFLYGSSTFDQRANSEDFGIERPSGIYGGNDLSAQLREERRFQIVDNLTLRRGNHTLKTGYDITRSKTRVEARFNPVGNFLYETDAPFEPGDCGDLIAFQIDGYCSADAGTECRRDADCQWDGKGYCVLPTVPCPGVPGVDDDGDGRIDEDGDITTYATVYQLIFGEPKSTLDDTRIGFFAQDSWQVSPKLLLDYGLRWDASTFRLPESARVETPNTPNGGAPRDWNDFAPRFGFTWQPRNDGKLVVRGGAGIFYDKLVLAFPAVSAITSGTKIGLYFPQGTTVELTPEFIELVGIDIIRQALGFLDSLTLRFSTGTELNTPYANQFNLGVEGAIGRGAWSANLIRTMGYSQPRMKDLNPVIDASGIDALPVHRDPVVGSIAAVVTEGRSWYSGLELGWKWRGESSWHSVSYTLSRSEDDGPDPLLGGIYLPPRPAVVDAGSFESFASERGRSDYDRRHRFVVAGEMPLPWWGLRLSSVAQYMSAAPFNVTTGRDDNSDGITTDRPQGVGRNTGVDTPLEEVNVLRTRFGLAPVTSLKDSSYVQVDLRVTRPFAAGKVKSGEFFAQVFNVFDRFNAGQVEGRATSQNFGQPITAAGPPRTLEFGIKLAM
jgi:hypothetical protein